MARPGPSPTEPDKIIAGMSLDIKKLTELVLQS